MVGMNLNKLNENQYKAVTTINGMVQVASCAGSGKTMVLTYRIAHMINDLKIDPSSIWVTTFTKKAAVEMIERLGKLITKEQIRDLTIGTFHGIGYRILKDEYTVMNDPMKNFDLIQGPPLKWLMEEVMKNLNVDKSKYEPEVFIAKINDLKMNLISPEAFIGLYLLNDHTDYDVICQQVYQEYERLKTERFLIDFNDMLYKVYHLLAGNKKILSKYQNRIKYMLIDEAQDNNRSQYELVDMLSEISQNVFIVGDDDQCIYKFRGAEPESFINFKQKYNATVINLEENYRSLPSILVAANNLISCNKTRVLKELKPFRKSENNITIPFIQTSDEDEEAEVVKTEIEKLNKNKNDYKSMAVIYRTNAQARAMEDVLIENMIPYVIFNGISFYERAEIKDILAYLKLAEDTNDNISFKRIINKPSRYLGKKFIEELEKTAKTNKCSLYKALEFSLSNRNVKKEVVAFVKLIQHIQSIQSKSTLKLQNVGEFIQEIMLASKYDQYLSSESADEEDNIRIENIHSLIKSACKFKSAAEFIKHVDMITNCKKDQSSNAVKLMTIHKSKGLEFKNVFIIGMSHGLLPHKYAVQDGSIEAMEEERRLAHVAMTRAEDFLLVTTPRSYQGKSFSPSIFIEEAKLEEVLPEIIS
jgi:DNA helicase-2/ATP-dependent DNA helicase PcrA